MGSGHDHSHGQPVEMVMGDDPSAYIPPNNLDFDALQGFYTDQIARLTQQVGMLVGQLSGTKQECSRLNAELVEANNRVHELEDEKRGWNKLPDVSPDN